MKKPDINTDAYRVVGECLYRIRHLLRDGLRAIHGENWESGIPEERLGFLQQRRSREASINWHLMDTSDVLDYAGFADLFEIVESDPQLQELFSSLAGDVNVLRIRFMELDTILSRIAYVREVADTEMSFLVSFDERIRKVVAAPKTFTPAPAGAAPTKPARAPEPAPRTEPKVAALAEAKVAAAPAAAAKGTKAEPAGRKPAAAAPAAETPPEAEPAAESPADKVAAALAANKDGPVLLALYGEITAIADGLWNQSTPPFPIVWEKVRESDWYHSKFATLGLKSISDFYGLVDEARDRLSGGASRAEMQDLLKERNFAQILLALRELFRHQAQVTN
jgi:hypothetical protein